MTEIENLISNEGNDEDAEVCPGNTNNTEICEEPMRPYKLTMEVPLLLNMLGVCLSGAVINNILLYKTCLHALHHSEVECVQFLIPENKTEESIKLETDVQKYATVVRMIYSVIVAFCPAILSLFLGVWSDIYGRKPLVVWPLFGVCMSSFLVVLYAMVNSLGPWWFVLTAIPLSLSGGYTVLFTGAFCYVNDIISDKDKSFRIALLEAVILIATILGTLSSPYLLSLIGNINLLLVTSGIYVMAYVYTNIWIEESIKVTETGSLGSIFNFSLVKEMIRSCFKRRPYNGRKIIFLLIMCCAFSNLMAYGLSNLDYLYTRKKLQWSLETFSIYGSVYTMIMIVGLLVGVTFVQKVLRVSDIHLALVSYLSCIADYLVKTFATTTWHMYLGASVSFLRGLAGPLVWSILSKVLPPEDLSKIFALMGVINGIIPLFAPIIFSSLYTATINIFPGAIYILGTVLYVISFVMLFTVKFYLSRYSPTNSYTALAK